MPDLTGLSFSAPEEMHTFSALLFDMDGTIIDSTSAIEKYWHGIGAEIGVDPVTILETSHGRRSIDTLAILCPKLANWDYICRAEGAVPKEHGGDAVEIPGARALLDALNASSVPWAIVTSGTRPLVQGWIDVLSLSQPKHLITAEQVERGKPDPAAYLLGAKRLGMSPSAKSEVLVLEDAPSGIRSGKAAGFHVVALATSHSVAQLQEAGADWIVRDMRSVELAGWDAQTGQARIRFRDALLVR
ncbi:HAD-like protein [Myriangium duriaei CBS 260.36]|uniref:HAD-like protein n=1 Tax=Myriangium duriaei CBS 260.36 TaxID=1168546 RepID=A0A9P4J4H6_9PEZI|nr:HAD-like protein [Myriangium duriaei CBS 260.36]